MAKRKRKKEVLRQIAEELQLCLWWPRCTCARRIAYWQGALLEEEAGGTPRPAWEWEWAQVQLVMALACAEAQCFETPVRNWARKQLAAPLFQRLLDPANWPKRSKVPPDPPPRPPGLRLVDDVREGWSHYARRGPLGRKEDGK
jgi:hypothetical protein